MTRIDWLLLACGAVLAATSAAAPAQWKPERVAELVVSAGPGGNQDATARVMQKVWQDAGIVPSSIVVNKPGGGGALAFSYASQHAGDAHYLLMLAPTMFTNRITGSGTYSYTDFTPVALLFNEYVFVAVRADSPIKSGRDLIQQLKAQPSSLSVAIATALGNHIHMGIAVPMKAAGVDVKKMKVVPFKSSGQSIAALLGGHVDVAASTFGTMRPYLESGKLRVIGVSAPQRLPGELAGVPTWKEQGAPATFDSWRGIAAAKGLTEAQVAYWEGATEALTREPAWKEDLERNHRIGNFMKGGAAARYWAEQYVELTDILTELGLAQGGKR